MLKRTLTCLIATAICWVPVSAHAATTSAERSSFAVEDVLPAEMCGFPLTFDVWGTTVFRQWFDSGGELRRASSYGPIWISFTRDDTGETARFAIPGPSSFGPQMELIRGTGRWFATSADGHPVIVAGNWRFPAGAPVGSGSAIDVCDRLSGSGESRAQPGG